MKLNKMNDTISEIRENLKNIEVAGYTFLYDVSSDIWYRNGNIIRFIYYRISKRRKIMITTETKRILNENGLGGLSFPIDLTCANPDQLVWQSLSVDEKTLLLELGLVLE